MQGYNHDAFMQVIRVIKQRARVKGLEKFNLEADTYPVVKFRNKPPRIYDECETVRGCMKEIISNLSSVSKTTLLNGLWHHANNAIDKEHKKSAAFILDLIKICEESIGDELNREILYRALNPLKKELEGFAQAARDDDYQEALQAHKKNLGANPDRADTSETFKFSRTKHRVVHSFLLEEGGAHYCFPSKLAAGKYLGTGGTCYVKSVDRIEEECEDKHLAMKMVRDEFFNDGEKDPQEYINNEFECSSKAGADIANITMYGPGKYTRCEGASTFYLTMRKAKKNMGTLFNERDKLKIVAAVVQTAQCIRELHARGIVHHDIKPGNVLINDDESVRLCDFASAKIFDNKSIDHKCLPSSGTKCYLYNGSETLKAIEQARKPDATVQDEKSEYYDLLPAKHWDIFSFIMILVDAFLCDAIDTDQLGGIFKNLSFNESLIRLFDAIKKIHGYSDDPQLKDIFKDIFNELGFEKFEDELLACIDRIKYADDRVLFNKLDSCCAGLTKYFKINIVDSSENNLTMENVIEAMDKAGVMNTAASRSVSQQPSDNLGVIEPNGGAEINLGASEETCCWCPFRFFVCVNVNEEDELRSPFISGSMGNGEPTAP